MLKLIQLKNGQTAAVLKNDTHISRWVEETGELCHDRMVPDRVLPLLKPGDYVVDAGANIGTHTVAYSQAVGPTGRVFAFEPMPWSFAALVVNTRNCENVKCFNHGLSDQPLFLGNIRVDENAGASRIGVRDPDKTWFPVAMNTLDVFCEMFHVERLDFLKMDIEGSEVFALQGAKSIIRRFRPTIMLEINRGALGAWNVTPNDIIGILHDFGYRMEMVFKEHTIDMPQFDAFFFPL